MRHCESDREFWKVMSSWVLAGVILAILMLVVPLLIEVVNPDFVINARFQRNFAVIAVLAGFVIGLICGTSASCAVDDNKGSDK